MAPWTESLNATGNDSKTGQGKNLLKNRECSHTQSKVKPKGAIDAIRGERTHGMEWRGMGHEGVAFTPVA